MPKKYNQKDIEKKVIECITSCPENLYQQKFVNYSSKTRDTHRPYSEIISEVLLNNLHLYSIPSITRETSYKTKSHSTPRVPPSSSNRDEERTAILLFKSKRTFEDFGTIIDYQVPLKNNNKNKKVGKIDLLSIKDDNFFILELKIKDNKNDGLLLSALEAYTYSKIIDADKLKKDYNISPSCKIVPAPLIFKGSRPFNEFQSDEYPLLHRLMDELGIMVFTLDEKLLDDLSK